MWQGIEARLTGKAQKEYDKLNEPTSHRINEGPDGLGKEPHKGTLHH